MRQPEPQCEEVGEVEGVVDVVVAGVGSVEVGFVEVEVEGVMGVEAVEEAGGATTRGAIISYYFYFGSSLLLLLVGTSTSRSNGVISVDS